MSSLICFKRTNSSKSDVAENRFDEVDKPPNSFHVTYMDIGALIFSIIFHFVDVGYDIFIAYTYFMTEQYSYFVWTVAFTLIPTVIITLISIRMYVEDCGDDSISKHSALRIALCLVGLILQSAPAIRYFDSLRYAKKSLTAEFQGDRKQQEKYYKKMLYEDSDVALLKVFECYLESAPQQVLQITLLLMDYIKGYEVNMVKQFIMIVISFVGMGLCMATYHRCIRFDQDDKKNISTLGTAVQFLWHLHFTGSRILAISASAVLYPFWTSIAAVCHWCGMTVWVAVTNKTSFCAKNPIFEVFFSGAVGLVYIFNFISLKDGPTRKSYIVFYLLCFIENVIAATLWGIKSRSSIKNWVTYIFLIFPIVGFLLSMIFVMLYYRYLHPNKNRPHRKSKKYFYGCQTPSSVHEKDITLDE